MIFFDNRSWEDFRGTLPGYLREPLPRNMLVGHSYAYEHVVGHVGRNFSEGLSGDLWEPLRSKNVTGIEFRVAHPVLSLKSVALLSSRLLWSCAAKEETCPPRLG